LRKNLNLGISNCDWKRFAAWAMTAFMRGRIIYESSHLWVLNKNPGELVIPSRLGAQDIRPVLSQAFAREIGARVWVVHRLDAEVSGLIIFAKAVEIHRLLSQAFENQRVEKIYWAKTSGCTNISLTIGQSLEMTGSLVRGKKRTFVADHGKPSLTQACFLGQVDDDFEWKVFPRTGRTHQIRAHFSHAGFPIVGDVLYGGKASNLPGIQLRSVGLKLEPDLANALDFPKDGICL
jgi:tRNA pseudouridine32 synthase/23S rRNA pseudouridine746 synthase